MGRPDTTHGMLVGHVRVDASSWLLGLVGEAVSFFSSNILL